MHPSTKNIKTESLEVLVEESLSAFYNDLMASGLHTPHSLVVATTCNKHCHFEWVAFIWLHLLASLSRIGTSPTPNSLVASGWRAKWARAWLSGLEIVNALHMEFCWIYKRHINKQKQLKKCVWPSCLQYPLLHVVLWLLHYRVMSFLQYTATLISYVLLKLSLRVRCVSLLHSEHSGGTPSRWRGLTSCCGRWFCGKVGAYLVL